MGLTPVMLFANVQLEAPDAAAAHLRRIDQAAAAGIPFLLTFGKTTAGQYDVFIGNLKQMAPVARRSGVTVVIKQHGGNTATGALCARIVNEVGDEGLKICYDAGNVMDYEHADPIPDIQTCWSQVRFRHKRPSLHAEERGLRPGPRRCGSREAAGAGPPDGDRHATGV